jgi:hypothetical protein
MRTDDNRNPTAFTTGIAQQAKLVLGVDYVEGTEFPAPSNLFTARLLGDPVAITIRVIDAIGYYTHADLPRWTYIAIPQFVWATLTPEQKRDVIGFQYHHEGGTAMIPLFPNYGKPGYF